MMIINGTNSSELLVGTNGDEVLNGLEGNDTLDGAGGADTLNGGDGDDVHYLYTSSEPLTRVFFGGSGTDTVTLTLASGESFGRVYTDRLLLDIGASIEAIDFSEFVVEGSDLTTTINLSGVSSISNAIWIDLGGGDDFFVGSADNDIVFGGDGDDKIDGGLGNDTLRGDATFLAAGNDSIEGKGGDDSLDGGAGDDTLDGGIGDDTLDGGSGFNTLIGGSGNDVFSLGGNSQEAYGQHQSYQGGDGTDTLLLASRVEFNSLILDADASVEQIADSFGEGLSGSGYDDVIDLSGVTNVSGLYQFGGIGLGWGNDSFIGTSQADSVDGGGLNDTLFGGDGGDTLDGGVSNDSIDGGSGNDSLNGGFGSDVLIGGAGNDTIIGLSFDFANDGDDNDTIFGGAGDDFLYGGAEDDVLSGGTGNDTLRASIYSDTLNGDAGDDVFVLDSTFYNSSLSLQGGAGFDVLDIQAEVEFDSLTLDTSVSIEKIILSFGGGLQGSSGSDVIDLSGVIDASELYEFAAADLGNGNDSFVGTTQGDNVIGGEGSDTLNGGGGDDTLNGGARDNLLNGGEGNDTLIGGISNDTLNGGTGDDFIDGGSGTDTAIFEFAAPSGANITADDANFYISSGSSTDTVVRNIEVFEFSDLTLSSEELLQLSARGPEGPLTIDGDAIVGQTLTANTSMVSDANGLGTFSYLWLRDGQVVSDQTADTYVITQEDVGFEISLGVNYVDGLGTLEQLTSATTDEIQPLALNLTGTDENERLVGSTGDDTINGGDGSDTIVGGEGDDTLIGGTSEDDLRDVIFGGDGNDFIEGGYGNDELRGDAGNDVIAGGFGGDTVIGGAGDDTVTGSALGDVLFGSDGDDFVNGGFGFDRVNGGAGADAFFHLGIADHGSDWIQDYNAAEGDVLFFGNASATRAQFQINTTTTPTAGADDIEEAFIVYRPTGQIMWALVDGDGQDEINLQIGGDVFDLMV